LLSFEVRPARRCARPNPDAAITLQGLRLEARSVKPDDQGPRPGI
jgi:hypothetical protein